MSTAGQLPKQQPLEIYWVDAWREEYDEDFGRVIGEPVGGGVKIAEVPGPERAQALSRLSVPYASQRYGAGELVVLDAKGDRVGERVAVPADYCRPTRTERAAV